MNHPERTMGAEDYRRVLLELLLEKYEASLAFKTGTSRRRPGLILAKSPLAEDYYDEMDHRKRESIHAAVEELAREGVVEPVWPRFKRGLELKGVYLNLEELPRAYALAGREPKGAKIEALRGILAPLAEHPWDWVRAYWRKMDGHLAARHTAGLDLADLDGYTLLVRSLFALADLDETQPKRVFSQRVLGDSKAFEDFVERRLLVLLKHHGPYEYETDEEYLDSVGLSGNPWTILFAGPLEIGINGSVLSFAGLPGEIGLSEAAVRRAETMGGEFTHILTIENLTTFHQAVRSKIRGQGLIVYTGGFPHRGVQRFLARLKDSWAGDEGKAPPAYHWGDLDYGGIRIFAYLRRTFFPDIQPYLMDIETYRRYKDLGTAFGPVYAKKLRRLLEDPDYADWHPVIAEMLHEGRILEQEAVGYQALKDYG